VSDTNDPVKDAPAQDEKPAPPRRRRRRRWFRYVILIAVLGVGGYFGVKEVRQRFTHVYEYARHFYFEWNTINSSC